MGYTNVDWVGSPIERRSTFGYRVFVSGNLVSWKSKKQNIVSNSNAEVEYTAMALTTCELVWLKQLIEELKSQFNSMLLNCDNQAIMHIVFQSCVP